MASILKNKNLTGITTTSQNQNDWSSQNSVQQSNGRSWNTSRVSKGTYQGLKRAERSYSSPYGKMLSGAVRDIQGRKDFEYDLNEDALYKQYAEQYKALGNQAMQDTMANAATLTGGYGNSYATTAGQQAYNSYLQQLNDIVPQLYQQARTNYDNETQNLYNKANLYQGLDSEAYQRWSNNRNYYLDKYNNEWNRNAVSHSSQTDSSSQSSRSGSSSNNMQSTYANPVYSGYSGYSSSGKGTKSSGNSKNTGSNPKITRADRGNRRVAIDWLYNNGLEKYITEFNPSNKHGLATYDEWKATYNNGKDSKTGYWDYLQDYMIQAGEKK